MFGKTFTLQEVETLLQFADANLADIQEAMQAEVDANTTRSTDLIAQATALEAQAREARADSVKALNYATNVKALVSKLG